MQPIKIATWYFFSALDKLILKFTLKKKSYRLAKTILKIKKSGDGEDNVSCGNVKLVKCLAQIN